MKRLHELQNTLLPVDNIRTYIDSIYLELISYSRKINKGASHSDDIVHDIIEATMKTNSEWVADIMHRGKLKSWLLVAVKRRSFDKTRRAYRLHEPLPNDHSGALHYHLPDIEAELTTLEGMIITLRMEGYKICEIIDMTGVNRAHIQRAIKQYKHGSK